jgi:hypothetical protein
VLISILYLKGVSIGDFEEALIALLSKNAGELSRLEDAAGSKMKGDVRFGKQVEQQYGALGIGSCCRIAIHTSTSDTRKDQHGKPATLINLLLPSFLGRPFNYQLSQASVQTAQAMASIAVPAHPSEVTLAFVIASNLGNRPRDRPLEMRLVHHFY